MRKVVMIGWVYDWRILVKIKIAYLTGFVFIRCVLLEGARGWGYEEA